MNALAEFRKRSPQYDDLNDEQLARALHGKFQAERGATVPLEEFMAALGLEEMSVSAPSNEAAKVDTATPQPVADPTPQPTEPADEPTAPAKPLSEIQITERVQDETGSTYEVSRPAEQVLAEHDQRLSALSALLDCLAA